MRAQFRVPTKHRDLVAPRKVRDLKGVFKESPLTAKTQSCGDDSAPQRLGSDALRSRLQNNPGKLVRELNTQIRPTRVSGEHKRNSVIYKKIMCAFSD